MSSSTRRIKKWIRILSDLKPLFLAHHPLCDKFEAHTLKVGDHRLCLGCFTIYPTVILSLFFMFNYELYTYLTLPHWTIIPIGIFICSIKLLSSHIKFAKVFTNIIFGIGVSLSIYGIWYLPIPTWQKAIVFVLYALLIGVFAAYRFHQHIKICDELCEYRSNWKHCPGLREIYEKVESDLKEEYTEAKYSTTKVKSVSPNNQIFLDNIL